MPSTSHPSLPWIKKAQLHQIGLSRAIQQLLIKASLLSALLLVGSCTPKQALIRYIPANQMPQTQIRPPEISPPVKINRPSAEYAKDFIGQKALQQDCSKTIQEIYKASGRDLGSPKNASGLFQYIQKQGSLSKDQASPGDLIFFHAPNHSQVNRVGYVERIFPDQTILFINCAGSLVVQSRMNLASPHLQLDPKTGHRLNHILKRVNKYKGYTAAQLFTAFGKL